MNKNVSILDVKDSSTFERLFTIIPASSLSMESPAIKGYSPKGRSQKKFLKQLSEVINSGIMDFRKSYLDPSVIDGKIVFSDDLKPSFNYTADWWEKHSRLFLPEKKSRLINPSQYIAFCGVILEKLVEYMPVEWAWKTVCEDSSRIGEFWFYPWTCHDYMAISKTGFADLANSQKILKGNSGFSLACSKFDQFANQCYIAEINPLPNSKALLSSDMYVGSIVTDV